MVPQTMSRRRPAGWSPLRNVIDEVKIDGPLGAATRPAPTHPAAAAAPLAKSEAESSEEEDSTKVAEDPFHCPSKPWKTFVPAPPTTDAAPTDAAPLDLLDTDLLG